MSIGPNQPDSGTSPTADPALELAQKRQFLASHCRRALKSHNRTLEKQQAECDEAARSLRYSHEADTLMANLTNLKRGTTAIDLTDVHSGEVITIRLNAKLDARENAELMYRKARKGRRGIEMAQAHLEQSRRTIAALETHLERLKTMPPPLNPGDLEAVEAELVQLKAVAPARGAPTYFQKGETVPYRHYHLDGWDIYVGRTSTQNDELTTRFAKPWDVWLHVGQHAGSHVVVRRPKNGPWPPDNVMNAAAGMAAWFSKARHSSFAEVHVAEKRFVYKRRKAPAGEVVMEQFKTIRTTPVSPQALFKGLSGGNVT